MMEVKKALYILIKKVITRRPYAIIKTGRKELSPAVSTILFQAEIKEFRFYSMKTGEEPKRLLLFLNSSIRLQDKNIFA